MWCLQVGIIGVGPHVERSILQNTLATLQGLRTAVHRCLGLLVSVKQLSLAPNRNGMCNTWDFLAVLRDCT